MDELNVAVVDDAVAEILVNPDGHNQEYWAYRSDCGTTMCLAGHIVTQAGYQIQWIKWIPGCPGNENSWSGSHCTKDGEIWDIEYLAAKMTGLPPMEAGRLFHCYGDAEHVARVWKEIKQEHGL